VCVCVCLNVTVPFVRKFTWWESVRFFPWTWQTILVSDRQRSSN